MISDEEMQQRIARLEAEVQGLTRHLEQRHAGEQFRHRERDNFSRYLATSGFNVIFAILLLIGVAIGLRFYLETRHLAARATGPVPNGPVAGPSPTTAPQLPSGPVPRARPGPASGQLADGRQALDNYVDNAPGKSGGGNAYSITLSGLGEVVDSLVKTGQITAEKASDLMQELGKHAIATTGDILKETAKAIIARHLGPKSDPREAAGIPAQTVQVNVYASEKQVTANRPQKKSTTPAKPQAPCTTPVADTKPPSCQAYTQAHGS